MKSLRLSDFDYHLPPELIAQHPAKARDHSRLLLLNKRTGAIEHRNFFQIIDFLNAGDVLVVNNSKVFPARLRARKISTGGNIEVFLHQPLDGAREGACRWECLVRGKIKIGMELEFLHNSSISRLRASAVKSREDATWELEFNLSGSDFWKTIEKIGEVPLPPYIKRAHQEAADRRRYQTVFADARQIGSAAAPTAGLHFTPALLKKIAAKGVIIERVTLHVGLGTFSPVKEDGIVRHHMHSEMVSIDGRVAERLAAAKKSGRRIIAVGTTSCRALESVGWDSFLASGFPRRLDFWTDIFIYPGYKFKMVDALITNFHLPKSSLLMLVSAMAGQKYINDAYRTAVAEKYRFFSYGDAMFIY